MIFHESIDAILLVLGTMGEAALIGLVFLLGAFILYKYYERRRFLRELRMARISVDELRTLIDVGGDPIIIDARSITARALMPAIPGAILFGHDEHADAFAAVPRERAIVVYCSCPNEASAAAVAKKLVAHGFREVRPLVGGLEPWNATCEILLTT